MKCPYAVNRHFVSQTTYDYNEEGVETFRQTIEDNTAEFVDCLQDGCAAWRDGRCEYRGGD